MAKSWVITALVLLSLTAVARTQYLDLLQGFQQLLQQYQPNKLTQNNADVTRHTTDRQHNKQHTDSRRNNEQRKKKPTVNQFDEFIFGTTTKPSRKTTKSSSHPKIVSNNGRSNTNRNIVNTDFGLSNYEITTRPNRDKPTTRTTTIANNRRTYPTTTTENALNINLNNGGLNTRPVSKSVTNQKSEKLIAGTAYETSNNFNSRPATDSNRNNDIYTSTGSNVADDQNRPNNRGTNSNKGVANNRPGGHRNVNVAGLDNLGISDEIDTRNGEQGERTNFVRQIPNFGFVTSNRPGVNPGQGNSYPNTNTPNSASIFFPNSGDSTEQQAPELLLGPDEDDMTSLQKKRYVDLAERMCDRYKALNVKKLVALPPSLIPSPDPVEFNVTSCNPYSIPLVIGGKIVDITEFPHMALVGWKKERVAGYSWKCGGSLISDQYVMTAGHCTFQDKDSNAVSGLPTVIQLGSSYLDDPGAQVVKVSSVIRHPKYKRSRAYHDVALIKMLRRVTFSEVIKPACIGVAPSVGNKIIATGWGRTELGGDNSRELRSVALPIWDMGGCRTIWGTSFRLPNGPTPDSHVCAGDKSGEKDTCQGDSGGPAQVQDGCVWRVVAVTSIGKSCGAPRTPALYAVIPRAFVAAQVFGEEVDYGGRGNANSNRRGEEYYRN